MADTIQFRKDLERLVNIDSGKDCPQGIGLCMDFFAQEFRKMDWQVSLVDIGSYAPLFVAANRISDTYDFLLTGHLDTVFPAGTAVERPYREEGDFAYGPGVSDMKCGCLGILYSLRDLDPAVLASKNFVVLLQPDEEIGSPDSRHVMLTYAARSKACLVFECTEDSDREYHCIQRKGIIRLGYEFTGKAGHAGSLLFNGALSAINEMAYWIGSITALTDPEEGTTANIGKVSGGTASNVVAESAQMIGEIRFENPQIREKGLKLLEALTLHAEKAGIKAVPTKLNSEAPLFPNEKTFAYISKVEAACRRQNLSFPLKKRGGLSAANVLCDAVPICIDGLGPAGNKPHSEEEYMRLDTLEENLALIQIMLGTEV